MTTETARQYLYYFDMLLEAPFDDAAITARHKMREKLGLPSVERVEPVPRDLTYDVLTACGLV